MSAGDHSRASVWPTDAEDEELFNVEAASFHARVRRAGQTRKVCDTIAKSAPQCSFLLGGSRHLYTQRTECSGLAVDRGQYLHEMIRENSPEQRPGRIGLIRSAPVLASAWHLGGSLALIGAAASGASLSLEEDELQLPLNARESNVEALEVRSPHRQGRPGRSLLRMRAVNDDISPGWERKSWRKDWDGEELQVSEDNSSSDDPQKRMMAWKCDVSAPDLTTRSYMRNTISRERKLLSHADRTREKGQDVNWPWWRQRPLSASDPLPMPLSANDYNYSPEGLSGSERRKKRDSPHRGSPEVPSAQHGVRKYLEADHDRSMSHQPAEPGHDFPSFLHKTPVSATRISGALAKRGAEPPEAWADYIASELSPVGVPERRARRASFGDDLKGFKQRRGLKRRGWSAEEGRRVKMDAVRRIGQRHVGSSAVSPVLEADFSVDRSGLELLVRQTNDRLRARGQRALQRSEAARRMQLQENILAVQRRLDSSIEKHQQSQRYESPQKKEGSISVLSLASLHNQQGRDHTSMTGFEHNKRTATGIHGLVASSRAKGADASPALPVCMDGAASEMEHQVGKEAEKIQNRERKGCLHVRRLTAALTCLIDNERFLGEGGDRPCKGYVDMMVVLRRVAEAGDMIIAKEKF